MGVNLLVLTASILVASSAASYGGDPLGGSFGLAMDASLNQVDILADMTFSLPPELQKRASKTVSVAQQAHNVAVRNLLVVERGKVTADYRRWKLRRAIRALVRADRKRAKLMQELMAETPPQLSALLSDADHDAHAESTRAVNALREVEKNMPGSGIGAGTASSARLRELDRARRGRGSESGTKSVPPPRPCF
jgi:hypothetical protein